MSLDLSTGSMGGMMTIILVAVGVLVGGYVFYQVADSIETPQTTSGSVNLSPNSDLVVNSGYADFDDATGTFGTGTTQTQRHFLSVDNLSQIRQSGVAKEIDLKLGANYDSSSFTSFYVSIWRHNATETGWNKIDDTGDILSKIQATAGGEQTISLSSGEWLSHNEGDFIGFGWTNTVDAGNPSMIAIDVEGSGDSTYFFNDAPVSGTTDVDWSAESASTNWAVIKLKSQAPSIVFIGDSITGGAAPHTSYIESDESADSHEESVPYLVGQALGVSIQNMGHGSPINVSADGLSRFTEDVVDLKPKAVVIGYGTADINNSVPLATFSSNMQSMITEAKNAGITPLIHEVYPRDFDTGTKDTNRGLFNDEIRSLAASNEIEYISNDNIGDGGTPNALDAAYDSGDGVHPNAAGHALIADNVETAMNSASSSSPNQNFESGRNMVYTVIGFLSVVVLMTLFLVFRGTGA